MPGSDTVSVVVVDLDGRTDLASTRDALRRTEGPDIEVVVVDDAADTPADDAAVRRVHGGPATWAVACNAGLRAASGDLVAFIFAGSYPDPVWLSRLIESFADEELAATGGALLGSDGVTVRAACWTANSFGESSARAAVPPIDVWSSPYSDGLLYPSPGNSIFRRDYLVEIRGYDERYVGHLAHADVCRRLLDRGWVVRPIQHAAVFSSPVAERPPIDAVDAEDQVLFALTHGLERHSFDDVARRVAGVARRATNTAEAGNQHLGGWNADAAAPSAQSPDPALARFVADPRLRPKARRLHVCYVAQEWLPVHNGVARLVHARASGLAARGHHVRVLTLTEGPLTVGLEDGIWVHRIPTTEHPPPELIMPPRLWNRSASVLDELRRIDEQHPVDLVDVPNWDVEGYATIVDGQFTTVLGLHSGVAAYVATDPRFSSDDPIVQEVLAAELTCYRHADAFLAASTAVVEEIEHQFAVSFPRDRLALVPHGLPPLDTMGGRQPEVTGRRDLEVLFVGRLEPRKGVDTVLAAIPMVLAAAPQTRFTFVGDDTISSPGGSTFRLEFESSEIGRLLADRVSFLGIVDDNELLRRYHTCDVFVAPSRFESFGLILLEAMRMGKPVIAGDAGGMREVIGLNGAGLLVPPGDVDALADALISLLLNQDLRHTVGEAGRRRFEQNFTLQRMIDGIEAFLCDLAASKTA